MRLRSECFGIRQNIVDKRFGRVLIRSDVTFPIRSDPVCGISFKIIFNIFFRSDPIGRFRSVPIQCAASFIVFYSVFLMYNILVTKRWKNTFELIIILSNSIRHDRGVHAETWVKIMFQNILYTTEVWFGGF